MPADGRHRSQQHQQHSGVPVEVNRRGQTPSISVGNDIDEEFEYHLHDDNGGGEMPLSIRPRKQRSRSQAASRERAGQVCSLTIVAHCTSSEFLLIARACCSTAGSARCGRYFGRGQLPVNYELTDSRLQ